MNIRWAEPRKAAWAKLARSHRRSSSELMRLVSEEFMACDLSDEELRELDMAEYIGMGERGLLVQALESARHKLIGQMARAEQRAGTATRASKKQRK